MLPSCVQASPRTPMMRYSGAYAGARTQLNPLSSNDPIFVPTSPLSALHLICMRCALAWLPSSFACSRDGLLLGLHVRRLIATPVPSLPHALVCTIACRGPLPSSFQYLCKHLGLTAACMSKGAAVAAAMLPVVPGGLQRWLWRIDRSIAVSPSTCNITPPPASAAIGPSALALRAARASRPACRRGRIAAMAASAAAPRMPRRPLGQTGLEVSVLGFGASPLGGVFQVPSCCRMGSGSMFSQAHDPPLVQGEPPPPPPPAPTAA